MRYNLIRKMDISNGPGVRVSIFTQGCSFHCKNCFNKETWDFEGGKEFNQDTIDEVLKLWYGDYMQLPPEKDRIYHHLYKAYKK